MSEPRIRWHDSGKGSSVACTGYVGTLGEVVFKIYAPGDDKHCNWLGISQLSHSDDRYFHGVTLDDAKEQAEHWLVRFVSYLGASFFEDTHWRALRDDLTKRIEQDFAQHRAALDSGEDIAAASYGGLVSANRTTLAKMRELEAGQ